MVGFVILLIVVVIVMFCAAGWYALFSHLKDDKVRTQRERDPAAELDAVFDGRHQVVYEGHPRSLKLATLVAGASQRGYRLVTTSGEGLRKQQVFEQRS